MVIPALAGMILMNIQDQVVALVITMMMTLMLLSSVVHVKVIVQILLT
jgi:hypothetical protein